MCATNYATGSIECDEYKPMKCIDCAEYLEASPLWVTHTECTVQLRGAESLGSEREHGLDSTRALRARGRGCA